MISLLLQSPEVKLRMSVNNQDIIRMYLGYNLLNSQRPTPISALCTMNTTDSTGWCHRFLCQ